MLVEFNSENQSKANKKKKTDLLVIREFYIIERKLFAWYINKQDTLLFLFFLNLRQQNLSFKYVRARKIFEIFNYLMS